MLAVTAIALQGALRGRSASFICRAKFPAARRHLGLPTCDCYKLDSHTLKQNPRFNALFVFDEGITLLIVPTPRKDFPLNYKGRSLIKIEISYINVNVTVL